MGADKGVHVIDDAIAGSDALATSLVLAEAIKKIGRPDLVVCGMASTDGSMSVVPAMLAERLGLPQVTLASLVETQGDQIRIRRDGDTATEIIEGTLPVVLSVTDQTGEARYPSFKGIMAAKKKPVETWSLADLGVDAEQVGLSAAWTQVEETARVRRAPPARSSPTRTAPAPPRWSSSSPPRSSSEERTRHELKFSFSSTTSTARSARPRTSCSPSPAASVSRRPSSSARSRRRPRGAEEVRRREDLRRRRRRDQGLPGGPEGRGAASSWCEKTSPAAVLHLLGRRGQGDRRPPGGQDRAPA